MQYDFAEFAHTVYTSLKNVHAQSNSEHIPDTLRTQEVCVKIWQCLTGPIYSKMSDIFSSGPQVLQI